MCRPVAGGTGGGAEGPRKPRANAPRARHVAAALDVPDLDTTDDASVFIDGARRHVLLSISSATVGCEGASPGSWRSSSGHRRRGQCTKGVCFFPKVSSRFGLTRKHLYRNGSPAVENQQAGASGRATIHFRRARDSIMFK